jgi:tetraacyldisaccharide 4'-kinase
MLNTIELKVTQAWEHQNPWLMILRPLSIVFGCAVSLRRFWYQLFKPKPLPVPVWVIGNISVGGSGKTPIVIALARALKERGFKPGIISRGFGGDFKVPTLVLATHTASEVGDEPLLIQQETQVPVMIGRKRRFTALELLKRHPEINIILSDDGLQHYALPRTREICVVGSDIEKQRLLPEGTLREPLSRLTSIDYCVSASEIKSVKTFKVHYESATVHTLDGKQVEPLSFFSGKKVHAVAGIARPFRFFDTLKAAGLKVVSHPFPDHCLFKEADLNFGDDAPILMTSKDAVKCQNMKTSAPIWVVPLEATLDKTLLQCLIKDLESEQKVI